MRGVKICPVCGWPITHQHDVATRLVDGEPALVHRACHPAK